MFTPQQLETISFDKVHFGGYDMQSVDELLEPLLADYSVLYRENSTLKSKMRILVDALEKYRQNENSAKEALQAAQRTCDAMIREAEEKSLAMLHEAQANAQANAPAPVSQLTGEDVRQRIESMEQQLQAVLAELAEWKEKTARPEEPAASDAQPTQKFTPAEPEEDMAKVIAQNMEKLVGVPEEPHPQPKKPNHPESITSRFSNLQFGKNYDPKKR